MNPGRVEPVIECILYFHTEINKHFTSLLLIRLEQFRLKQLSCPSASGPLPEQLPRPVIPVQAGIHATSV